MAKKILVLNGNPKGSSYGRHLADVYQEEALKHASIQRFDLADMAFNPSLDFGYDKVQVLEACLVKFQQAVLWAEHIVIFSPIWWGGIPAKLKGLFERAFLPRFSFQYETDSPEVIPLLTGKTSRLVLTMDAPPDYVQQQATPAIDQLDTYTLQFCGVAKAEVSLIGSIIMADEKQKDEWQSVVQALGGQGA